MSFHPCWRCLIRTSERAPSIHPSARVPTSASTAPFSTSAPTLAKITTPVPQRGARTTFIKKKKKPKADVKSRPPGPGERKAYRKRVVLSNTNALPVAGMEYFSVEGLGHEQFRGKVLGIPGQVVDQLRAVDAFKPTQGWGLFRQAGMLVRKETVEYGKLLEELQNEGKSLRRVLVGDRGSGKSLMALQAMSIGFLKGWTIINIPEAQELTIGHTEYAPLPGTSPLLFVQKGYTAKLLSQISRANLHLENIQLSSPPSNFPIPIQSNISLAQLAGLGASDPEIAWPIFQLLVSEITKPNDNLAEDQRRPPVLFCIDSLSHAMKDKTAYMTAAFKSIHAHDLALVNWFMGYLSGTTPLPNGGLILACTSESNKPPNPSLDLALARLEVSSQASSSSSGTDSYAPSSTTPNPFFAYDQRVLDIFKRASTAASAKSTIDIHRLRGLSKAEARGLMEYWARSGILRQKVDESLVGEKWSLSGGGIIGELERGCVRMRI